MTRIVAVDTESTGLHPYHGDVCTVVSMSDAFDDWSYDIRSPEAGAAAAELRRLAEDPDVTVRMHGSPYDRAVISQAFGVEFADARVWDTQTGDWLISEADDHRLKEGPGTRLFGVDARVEKEYIQSLKRGRTQQDVYRELRAIENEKPKPERERATVTRERARDIAAKTHKDWGGPNPFTYEDLREYAEKDTRLTYDIGDWQVYEMTEGRHQIVYPAVAREQKIAGLAYRMTKTGVRVDAERAAQELAAAEAQAAVLAEEFSAYNLEAPHQVAEMLYDDWGLKCSRHTDGGARSTDKWALDGLTYDARVLRLLEYRSLSQALKLFYRPLAEKIGTDGRVHPSWNPHRTVTGRWSCSGPNLMQLPKYDPDKPPTAMASVKHCFVPDPGMVLVSADLPNAELRIAASLCNVQMWLDAFENGVDLHQVTADGMGMGRHEGKTCNYALLYGSGPKNLALQLSRGTGKPPVLARGKEVYNAYWRAVPEVRRVMDQLDTLWTRKGWIPIPGHPGRVRHLTSMRGGREPSYKALNAIIQGSVAEMVKDWTLNLEPELAQHGIRMVMQVHDSVVLEVPEGLETLACKLMQETVDAANGFSIPFPLDFKVGSL